MQGARFALIRGCGSTRLSGMPAAKGAYTAEHIQVLEGLEPVRKRPGMYIGSTDMRGLHHLVYEIVENAISSWMKAEVRREGKVYVQEYRQGKPAHDVRSTGKTEKHGTTIEFTPDPKIFATIEWSLDIILTRLRQQAYLTKGVAIGVIDARKERPEADKKFPRLYRFAFEGGIRAYVVHLNEEQEALSEAISFLKETPEGVVEVALQYSQSFQECVWSFANNIHTAEGGHHLTGFKTALTRTINAYARQFQLLKEKDENLTADDVREGLTAVVSVRMRDPQFEGQTKSKLGNAEMKSAVETVVNLELGRYLEEHPGDAKQIVAKCLLASRARLAARAARDSVIRKCALGGMTLPGKLRECPTRNLDECALVL